MENQTAQIDCFDMVSTRRTASGFGVYECAKAAIIDCVRDTIDAMQASLHDNVLEESSTLLDVESSTCFQSGLYCQHLPLIQLFLEVFFSSF